MYLLDTNVISETRKPRPHGAVLAWIASLPARQFAISAVTIGELQRGVEGVRKHDMDKAREISAWIDRLSLSTHIAIISPDAAIFRTWAALMKGRANNAWEDALIAATALHHSLVVATRNTQDFDSFSVELFNPFLFKEQL